METQELIVKLRKAFGEKLPLPVAIIYTDEPIGETPAKTHCMIKHLLAAIDGQKISLAEADVLCRGGKVYAGYADINDKICNFVSGIEKYKDSPEGVAEFVANLNLKRKDGKFLNFIRIDHLEVSLDKIEGVVFFATPDILSGLWSWANFDTNNDDSVIANFGSGCSSTVANLVRENDINGYRCFIGMLDISVRPLLRPDTLTFSIPRCRLIQMVDTIDRCCLNGAPAWLKVKSRING